MDIFERANLLVAKRGYIVMASFDQYKTGDITDEVTDIQKHRSIKTAFQDPRPN